MKYATISTRNLFHFCYRFFLVNVGVLLLTASAEALSVSPILDYMASHAPSYLESDHAKYTLTTDQGENTHFILINGTKYYYTPAEQTAEQNNYLVFLTGTALTQTGATSENYVFTDGTNYYTFDTSNLPSSSYILTTEGANEDDYNIKIIKGEDTTYYTFDLKDSAITKNGLVTLTPSTAEDYTIAVALPYDEYYEYDEDYNEYHFISTPNTTKYYKMSIDQSKASHVGGKISWSGILSEFSDDYWQELQDDGYYTWSDDNVSGSNTIVDTTAKTVSGAIRLKTPSNGNSPNYWNNHVTYTYTAPNNYEIIQTHINNQTTTGNAQQNKVFAGITYDNDGGAIYNTGSISSIISDFTGNSSSHNNGGAVYNNYASATIDNIIGDFIANNLIVSSSESYQGGGAIANTGTINSIVGDFITNSAVSSFGDINGGAIYKNNSASYIGSITGDFIANNATSTSGSAGGGAIYNADGPIGSIIGNFIANNATSTSGSAGGGAIYNAAGSIGSIIGNFINNNAMFAASSGSSSVTGGAILNAYTTIGSITGDFIGNSAISNSSYSTPASGGAIHNTYGIINSITGDFISNSIMIKSGSITGGAIYNDGGIGNISGDFINNRITVRSGGTLSGAALYNSGTITSVVGDFINNITKSLQSNNPAPSSGGAIYNSGKIGSLTGDFINNSVTLSSYNYGTVKSEGGAIYNATSATISSITGDFINNSASSGGAIYNFGNISSITGNFINNISNDNGNDRWSKAFGGAIYNSGVINSITGDFVNNSAEGHNQYSSVYGGAIYNSGANAVIDSITGNFINNSANSYSVLGGVINNASSATINSITGDFINNESVTTGYQGSIYGGAIYNGSTIGSITGDFISNKATTTGSSSSINGGVIYNFGSIYSINGKFINNSAAGAFNKKINGGIIYNNRTINSIAGEFTSNTIANSNGIIYNSGTNATISDINSDFISNNITGTSTYGGIIYNYSSASIGNINGDFIENSITGGGYGGIIYNYSNASIGNISGDFIENTINGSFNGGLIYNGNPSTINSITGNFINNKIISGSSGNGGAIYIFSSRINSIAGDFTGNNVTVTNSSGKAYGGAIHLTGTGANIGSIIGDFTDNSVTVTTGSSYSTLEAKGGAIYSYSGASIGSISGNFTGNYVSAINTSTNLGTTAAGGAIFHNEGTIGSITADFTSNSATSSLNAYGGAIYNYSRINSIAGDFTGNNVTVTNSSGKAYGGAIYSGRLYANFPSYYQGGVQLTLAGNTFTDNYVQIGETITPNSIYNAGEINIADSATVTINDGYDGLSQAQLNIGNNSIFNLSVDNGILQTDNLGTVTNNGSINWDMDADLLAADSDKITVTSLSGTQSVLIRAINLLNDKEGITDILLTENDTLKSAYTLSSAINDSIFSPNDYIYTVSYNSENGILTFNGIDPIALLGDATIDTINKQSREYLKLGADNHAVYTDLVTEKDDDHPDAVIIAGTTYYFSAAESTDEMTAIVRNLAATGADALREVNSNEDYIFNINDKYYTYKANKLPVSAWFKGDGTEDGYDYYDYADDNTTKQYYTFALKDSAITKNGLVTFTSSTAEDYDLSIALPNGTKYYKAAVDMSKTSHLGNKAVWSDISTTAPEGYTWADEYVSGSNAVVDLDAKTVSGAIRMKSSHNGETPETWNNWQTFTYTAPADYELIQTRVSSIDADGSNVKNKVFVGISGSQEGSAIYNTTSLPTVDIVADFINNSNVASSYINASSDGGAIYNENASIHSIVGDFINNRVTNPSQYTKGTFMGGAIYNFNGTIDSIVGDFISNSVAPGSTNYSNIASGSAIANVGKNAEIKSIMGSFINNFAKGSTVYGGVIYNYGTIGSINGDFINNRAEAGTIKGAVIYNNDSVIGTITGDFINNSSNNTTNENGGAIYNSGTNAIISSVIGDFINNKLGLIIYNYDGARISTITGDFINNTSRAIYNHSASIDSITGDFISNNSTLQGVAIFNFSGTITSITGDFINNSANRTTEESVGAIYNYGTITSITGDFINNSAEGRNAYGGAISNYRDSIIASITGDFISNSVKATNYYASGGAIYNSGSNATIGSITGNFSNNSATGFYVYGGAIYNNGSNATIGSITGNFSNNSATGFYTYGGAIYNTDYAGIGSITGDFINNSITGSSYAQGGAINNSGSNATINTITGNFISNRATSNNYASGGAIYNSSSNATIGSITGDFIDNQATTSINAGYGEGFAPASGGAIYNSGSNGTIGTITGDFINNIAKSVNSAAYGGAINNRGIITTIEGDFINNNAITSGAEANIAQGGAVYNLAGTIGSITGNFNNNSATGSYAYGGAIHNTFTIGIISGDFIANSVKATKYSAYGGAISNSGELTITGDFINNTADGLRMASGGAIYNSGTNATINSITGDFINNSAITSGVDANLAQGGAVYNTSTISSITGDFINNDATSTSGSIAGGAIYNQGTISSITGDFTNNSAKTRSDAYGGAINNDGIITTIAGNFTNNKVTSVDNDCYAEGGAIYNVSGTIHTITGDFVSNSAKATNSIAKGGAIYNGSNAYSDYSIGTITGDFINNSVTSTNSSAFGGAINNEGGYSVINNVTGNFENNKAKGDYAFGGAVSNNGGAITITGDFTNNSAESYYYAYGGAIFNGEVDFDTFKPISSESSITLTGNTFTGNYIDSPQTPNSIYNAGIINIAEGATVTINDGWQSINGAQLIMGENSTLNMNIANGILQNDSLGLLTKNGTINATVDVNFSTNKADTIATTSVTLTDGIKFVTLNDINILDDISNITKDTKVQILKTQANGLELVLSDTLQARLAAMDEIFIGAVDGTGFTIVDDIAVQTDWSHKYQKHITADELSFGKLGLATTYTKNDSLGIIETRRAVGETADVNLPDDTLKLVNTADIGNRSFDSTINSETYKVIEDLGETAAGIIAINGISGGEIETINLNGKRGFDLANATTLELNNVKLTGNDTLATVENANAVINLNNAEVDGDIVSTTGYTMGLSGDNILTGNVGEASMTISSGSLKINDETLKDASLNTTGGTIILTDDGVKNYKIGSLTSSENAVYNIDFDITDIDNPIADTITANGSGTIKLGMFNLSGNISDLPIDMIDKPFIVQILKDSDEDLELVISEDAQSELGNNKYELAQTTHNRDDVVVAENTWDKVYNHKTQDEIFLGTIGLATTVNENDSIGITLNGESYLKDIVVGEKIGDTLKLVNQLDTAEEKTFDATADGETYTVSEDVGESKGALSIDGKGGTIDFAGYEAFEKIGTDTLVSLKDVTLTGAKGDIANVEGGTLTAKDTVIDGTMSNSGIVELTNSTVGNIINNGLIEINSEVTLGEVSGTGITNINADMTLTEAIRGNTVNVKEASLSGANKLGSDVTLNALGATINIENNEVKVKNANFDATSTLALKINSLEDHGLLTAKNIDIAEGAKLQATLAQGLATVGKTSTVRLLSAKNIDFNNFADSYDNNMYHFEKADKNGLYNISLVKTAEDVAKETEGENWVSDAASAWVDGKAFADDTITAAVADKLADLAQNNAEGLVEEVKKIAPTETTAVLAETTENTNRLFKIVDAYLRGEQSQMGFASGDNLEDVTLWGRVYIGESKISKRGITAGSDANSRGAILSIEKKLDKSFKLGVGAQFDTTDIKAYSRKSETNTTVGFVYSEYKPDKWFINSVASYGYSKFDESKYALGTHYDSEYNVHMSSLAAMFGYEFDVFTPEAGLRYYHIKQEGYTDALGQSIKDDKIDILRAVAGIRMKKDFGRFRPEAYVGLTYDIHSDKGNTTVNLANGSSYTVPGKRLNKLGYETSIGVEAKITDNISASVSYIGAYRDSYQEHTGMFNIKYSF